MAIKGVGKVKAVQILALGEFCKRAWERKNTRKSISFSSPDVVANYYKESIRHLEVEELRIIFLDTCFVGFGQRDFDRKLKAFGGKCYFTAQSSKW